jgi:hypothetical protein
MALAIVVAAIAAPGPGAAGVRAAPSLVPTAIGVAAPLGMSAVVDQSKDGRYVLGRFNGRFVVRDVVRGRTVRRLPSSSRYAYHGLSDNGRYVVYTNTRPGTTSCYTPWVRDRKTNKARSAATTSKGRALKAGWTPSSTQCPDEPAWRTMITYSDPAISGNGRYVAFCVNLTVPDRLDLYVKDMRTKRIRTFPGACSEATDAYERPQPPQISETGRVVLLPGFHATGDEAGYNVWTPARILLNRSTFIAGAGGAGPVLTEDGSAVFSIGPTTCSGGWTPCPGGPIRYDVATAATVALPAGDPGPGPMSRRGRYALVTSGPPGARVLTVRDRATGASTGLTAAFAAAGAAIPSSLTSTRLSGDAKVVLIRPDGPSGSTWYRVRWM